MSARYSLGIDLGTTHCALAWVDLENSEGDQCQHGVLEIAQLVGAGSVQAQALLPSFMYLAHEQEFAETDLSLPWPQSQPLQLVGELARARGAGTPIRLVSSAKSWLCHAGIDRHAAILPADAPAEIQRVSPILATQRYLEHLRAAWNHSHPEAPFDEQEITITIPASFDPAARELSLQAAQQAGYPQVLLLEEPQAAMYSWIQKNQGEAVAPASNWRKQVKPGDIILVVDIGGGTSDFSLIAVQEQDGQLALQRIAVGEHILLGGDNMDLTLAHILSRKLAQNGNQLDAWQMRALSYACRSAKEQLLADSSIASVPLVVPSRGSKLIGGSIRTELTREEVTQVILEGFFPKVEASARPAQRPRAGLTQVGLPYAQDAAVTRHLAALLARQRDAAAELSNHSASNTENASFLHPSAVLFNGGVFKGEVLAQRCMETLNAWLAAEGAPAARRLDGADLDLAVARGAAYYGFVRRGQGVRIRGGTASAFYIGIESAMPAIPGMEPPIQALCVAPFGMEEEVPLDLPGQEFGLVVGEAVSFRFFSSSVRRQDQIGSLLESWDVEQLEELPALHANLPVAGRNPGDVVLVKLQACATETGTLSLTAIASTSNANIAAQANGEAERWKIEFDVRN